MNKKIIAIAIASALTAPAAMADITVSGSFYGEILSRNAEAGAATGTPGVDGVQETATSESTLAFADGGKNVLAFTATSGNVYGKMGLNVGPASSTSGGDFVPSYRDFFIGYKFGDASLQFGTMNGAVKNLEKDQYIATFLQLRGTAAQSATSGIYGSSGYISNVIQYKGKVGGGTLIAQYNPTDKVNNNVDRNEGHVGISYAAKTGGVNWFVGYNTGNGGDETTDDDTNMKLGASMKFGTIKGDFMYSSADQGATDTSSISLGATFDLGNGMSANINYGMQDTGGAADPTVLRLAVNKELAKGANIYAGYISKDPDTTANSADTIGLGMGIKF